VESFVLLLSLMLFFHLVQSMAVSLCRRCYFIFCLSFFLKISFLGGGGVLRRKNIIQPRFLPLILKVNRW
jgi:hypothetical protein